MVQVSNRSNQVKKRTPSWNVLATGLAEESSGMCENVKLKALLYLNTVSSTFALKLLICERALRQLIPINFV